METKTITINLEHIMYLGLDNVISSIEYTTSSYNKKYYQLDKQKST